MSFERHFVLVSHGLAALGVVALASTQQVGDLYVWVAILARLWSARRGVWGTGFELSPAAASVASVISLLLVLSPVFFAGAAPIRAIAEFLLVLTAVKGLATKRDRDWLQLYVLAFFELVSASALTVEPVFAILFLGYLLAAPWALVLFVLRRELGDNGCAARLATEPFVEPSLFRSVAAVTFLLFLFTVAIFVFFPRVGAGYFGSGFGRGSALTGFSDDVGLSDVSALKEDQTIAMRVTVTRQGELLKNRFYWRGAALDSFDGRRWRRDREGARPLPRSAPGVFFVTEAERRSSFLNQDVILEPSASSSLFTAGRVLEIHGRFPAVTIDGLGNLRSASLAGVRARYQLLASLGPRDTAPTTASYEIPPVDPRIVELARTLVAGHATEAARVDALADFFAKGFRYTLAPGDPGDADPLARFLFETKRGHCEYFASSLAVMLRAAGIAAVVVNGYAGGEWNPYGEYFLIRQRNAHSWVEAYVDGRWQTLDATPYSGERESSFEGGLAAILDSYRMRWYRYVVNYSLEDQAGIALSLRGTSHGLWQGLSSDAWRRAWRWLTDAARERGGGRRFGLPIPLAIAGALLVVAAAAFAIRRRSRARAGAVSWPTERYLELLRLLGRRGFDKKPQETPDEFYRRIAPGLDGQAAAIERLTALYQQARFSGRDGESAPLRGEIERLLDTLEERK